jgi:predicted MFS family arabinose efflux permease
MDVQTRSVATNTQVILMSVINGTTIANIYYAQPILAQIASSLHITSAQAGIIPMLSQLGFGVGLVLVAPLGDMVEAKRLVVALLAALCLSLLGVSLAPGLLPLGVASALVGACATAVQIIVPVAAATAPDGRRAHVVSIVFTGTLVGILSARIVSGVLSEWLSWRILFGFSAAIAATMCAIAIVALPRRSAPHRSSYSALIASTAWQLVRFPALRWLSLIGALTFGTFSSFWITLTFHLSGAPFNYGSDKIGLFGFAALAGAFAATPFGRLADKIDPARIQALTLGILVCGALCVLLWPTSVPALIIAALLLDVGVQGTQVNGLAQIYQLDESAHSRINTIYIGTFFIGGAIGSACGIKAWEWGGWSLVGWQLVALSSLAWACSLCRLRSLGKARARVASSA